MKSPELAEGHYTAEFWEYDSRIARRWEIDPVVKHWESGYACFHGNPIFLTDWLGLDPPKRLGFFQRAKNWLNRKDHVNKANKHAVDNKIDEKDIKELSDGSIDVDNRRYKTESVKVGEDKDCNPITEATYKETGEQKIFQRERYDGSQPAFTKPVSNWLVRNVDTHEGGNANIAGKVILKTAVVTTLFVTGGFIAGGGTLSAISLFAHHTTVIGGLSAASGDLTYQMVFDNKSFGDVNFASVIANGVFLNPIVINSLGNFGSFSVNGGYQGIFSQKFDIDAATNSTIYFGASGLPFIRTNGTACFGGAVLGNLFGNIFSKHEEVRNQGVSILIK